MTIAQLPVAERAARAVSALSACTLCARRCGADRTQGSRRATCQTGRLAKVAAVEDGAILFAGCNLRCLACNIAEASWDGQGREVTARELADLLLELQARGHDTIALVSPSHVPAQVLEALALADGLTAKLVWDSGGYDSVETLKLFEGLIDTYVPDVKHGTAEAARICVGVADYPQVNAEVVAEMVRQVGVERVIARHLILPSGLAGTEAVLAALPEGTRVELRTDYQPAFRANRMAKLNRRASEVEIGDCMQALSRSRCAPYK